jgi:uncharacterized membrane protein HdeD (DUF308 family)
MEATMTDAHPSLIPRWTSGPAARDLPWWMPLGLGILSILYGMLVLSMRPAGLYSIVILAAISFFFVGLMQIVTAFSGHGWGWLWLIAGVISIIGGIVALAWPSATLYVLAVFVSWFLAIAGIVRLIDSLGGGGRPVRWLGVIAGVLIFVIALWAIGSPLRQVLLFVNLVGFYMVIIGIAEIIAAFEVRRLREAAPAAGS